MKVGVLFDLDGTLLDTLEDLHNATNYILRQYGCPERSLEEIRRIVGNGARVQITKALPGMEDDPPLEQVLADYQAYYNAVAADGSARPYDGVLDAMAEIARRYPIAIVSNKPDPAVKALCKQYFGDVYAQGVSDACPRKPAPDMVKVAMASIGVDTCVYVGDSEVDVLTAQNAQVPCLTVLWGFRDKDVLEEAGAVHFCEKAADMPKMLIEIIAKEL